MRNAFSMIELIFVIVILGSLSVVIVPKLAATRTDAEAATKAQAIITATSEISAYATAQGNIDSDLSNMSNILESMEITNDVAFTSNRAMIKAGNITSCIIIDILGSSNENLSISFGNATGDNVCLAVQNLINLDIYPINIQGTGIVY